MRYSREALATIDACIDELRNASTIVQIKIAPGEAAAVIASRQFQIERATGPLFIAFTNVVCALMELGSDDARVSAEKQAEIEACTRELFADVFGESWQKARADARFHHLEAAE